MAETTRPPCPDLSVFIWLLRVTAVDPKRYTILDFRALFSLGIERSFNSVGFYLAYLAACRRIAAEAGVDLRTLDRALWQYSKENQKPR